MRGCLAGTDDPADLIPRCRIGFRPSMDNEQKDRSYQAHGLPTVVVRMEIGPAHRQRIVKDKPSCLEAQAVIPLVDPMLFVRPNPPHVVPIPSVATIL